MTVSTVRIFVAVTLVAAGFNVIVSLVHFETNHGGARPSPSRFIAAATVERNNKNASSSSTLQNFLNCTRQDSLCSFFDPVAFFQDDPSQSPRHHDKARQQLYGSPNRTLNANWARFVSHKDDIDWTYVHIRKAGGNTMYEIAQQLAKRHHASLKVEIMPSVPVHRLAQRIGEQAFIERMKTMVDKTTLFAFIRDPVSRFVSAMGQVADRKSHVLQQVKCWFPNDPRREIQCVLDHLKNGEVVNDHYTLASIEMYQMASFATHHSNKKVAVFSLDAMNDFMKLWNMQPFRRNEAKKTRYSTVLLNESMIRDICQVYEPDVIMMRLLGMGHLAQACDAHVVAQEQRYV